jgi:thiamine kinase-like enzyme
LLAADAGLAPKVFYAEPGNGLLVTEYLAGCKPDRHLLSSQQWQATLSNAIAAMRTLSVDVAPYPYRQQLQSYWQQLLKAGHTELEPQYRKALAALALLQTSQTPESLVHHDLSVDNLLLVADQLMFLDWEYAGKGYTIMDDVALLKLGLNRSSDHSASQWQAAQCIAEFLDKGWYLLR